MIQWKYLELMFLEQFIYLFMRADVVGYDTNITRNSEGQPLPYCINLLTSLVIEEHMK